MGRRGPLPKAADRVLGHRTKAELAARRTVPEDARHAVPVPVPVAPAEREEWLSATRESWRAYWASDVALVAASVDLPGIRRLFDYYDAHARAMDVVGMALVVRGAAGQIRVNPLMDSALKIEAHIARLEDSLGLSPAARQRMGIRLVQPVRQPTAAPATRPSRYGHLRAVAG